MDGQRALIYSRIRENRLNPAENDLTRADRQQAVVEAMTSKLAGPGTFFRLPFIGGDLAKPLTTDLSAGQLLQLGWVKFRANDGRALHCRLGGEPSSYGGAVRADRRRRRTRRRSRCSPDAPHRSPHRPERRSAPAAPLALQAAASRRPRPSSRRCPTSSPTGRSRCCRPPSGLRSSCARRARSRSSRNPSP